MHACMYVCIYLCIYLCIYVFVYLCMYVSMILCMYVFMCLCIYVCMYACMYVCMYVCMHVCSIIYQYPLMSIYISIFSIWALKTPRRGAWLRAPPYFAIALPSRRSLQSSHLAMMRCQPQNHRQNQGCKRPYVCNISIYIILDRLVN